MVPQGEQYFFYSILIICFPIYVPCFMFSPDNQDVDELPPLLNTWRKMYAAVLVNLLVLIILFYVFTRYFA